MVYSNLRNFKSDLMVCYVKLCYVMLCYGVLCLRLVVFCYDILYDDLL